MINYFTAPKTFLDLAFMVENLLESGYLIYLMECNTCKPSLYVGYTTKVHWQFNFLKIGRPCLEQWPLNSEQGDRKFSLQTQRLPQT